MATGALDANGVWQYGPDDPRVPFDDTLNLGQESVSTAIGSLKSRAAALEAANVLGAVGSPCVAASGWTVDTNRGRKKNGVAFIDIIFTRTGAAITVPASGDITNAAVATFAAGWVPAIGMNYPAAGGLTGELVQGAIASTGLFISAVGAGRTIPTGWQSSLLGSYPL